MDSSQLVLFFRTKSGIAHSLDFPIDVDFNSPPALDVLITACRPHQTSDFDDYPENESLFYPPNSPLTTSLEIANLSLLKKQWDCGIRHWSGLIISDGEAGAALAVEISVLDISTCKPLPNSMVEIWSSKELILCLNLAFTLSRGILNTCIRNVEASARERTGFRDTPDERKSRLAEADGDVMKDPINLERECVEEIKRYLYPTNTVSANSAITFLSSSNPSPEAPPPFLDNAEGPEHEANIPWGYRTVLEELAGVIDGLLEERQIESSVREEKIKDVLELRDEVGMLGGGVQEVEIRKGSHKERREQSIIDSEGIVYEKTKSKPTLHVKVPPNTDSNPSVSSTSTSPMLSTAIDSPATVISPPSATINITHGIFAISDSPPSTSPRNSSSPVFAVQTRENSIPHSSTLNIDTPSNTSHSSEVNKGGYLPTSPRRKDKGKARAPPEPVRHEPVLSPTSVLLGFRKGNVLLGPEEMEGEYDGEELRRELLETMIERPAPRSLHIDNPDEYGSILTPSPLSPTISNFYTNLIYSAVHTVDPSDTATCIIAASEFQSICTSNNATCITA
ncbi:hypothetical protein DFJ43DRAFT_1165926 [Lentinula guzmanii]|uniref:Uncharacterized protein n=1 Tax=Lentinula guzmanii TaxID=2804957 RepID=A0AA38JEH8_9AGAR|nr:hypothetical protein DFJ43DRAFT_1165926 [Lentinula guzmanii]